MLMSDYVYVIDIGGYIGNDTKREIEFCKIHNIELRYYSENPEEESANEEI